MLATHWRMVVTILRFVIIINIIANPCLHQTLCHLSKGMVPTRHLYEHLVLHFVPSQDPRLRVQLCCP